MQLNSILLVQQWESKEASSSHCVLTGKMQVLPLPIYSDIIVHMCLSGPEINLNTQ